MLFALILLPSPLPARAAGPTPPPAAGAQDEKNLIQAARAMRAAGRVQLNFKDLDISVFIRFMSELLGENIVVDPTVKGTVSVVSPRPVSFKEARQVMLSILGMNNLTLQDMGGYSKVMPVTQASGPGVDLKVRKSQRGPGAGEQSVIQVVPLDYVKAQFVVEPVKAAVPNINVSPLASNSGVVLSGLATLVQRAVGVIQALDAPDGVRVAIVIPLAYANAKTVEGQLNALAADPASKLANLKAVGDERSGRIVLVGSRQNLREAQRIVKDLDIPAKAGNFRMIRLINADAKTVSEQLGQILAVAAKLAPDAQGKVPSTVVPDLVTNSIIFSVSDEQFAALEPIVQQLDSLPRQVLIRGLICEVNLSRLRNAGFDWAAYGGYDAGSAVIGTQATLGNGSIPNTFLEYFKELTTEETVNYDANGNAVTTTNTVSKGLVFGNISMLFKYDAINVLSMPRLMCTDNLPSSLQVGEVIPVLKGKMSDVSNPAASQSTYDYKDTGLILKVTPHIRSGNLVALDIEQRIEDVLSSYTSDTPVTGKREIKTSVLVENGETIILGGLMKEEEKSLKNRVPGLSYIPLIGNLFTSATKQKEKVDLMVFLTPYIMRTPKDAQDATRAITSGDMGLNPAEKIEVQGNQEDYKKEVKLQ